MKDRRTFERLNVKFILRFSQANSTKEIEGESVDISGEGIGFITKGSGLTLNTPLEISLFIPGLSKPLYFKNKVAWSKKLEAEGHQRIGVRLEKEKLMKIAYALREKK